MYFNKHSELVNEYNNTIHRLITMKIVGFKANTYINFGVDLNIKKSTFKVSNRVSISKYKNSFANGCQLNWIEEFFVIPKVKYVLPGTYVTEDLNGEETGEMFLEKELQKRIIMFLGFKMQ